MDILGILSVLLFVILEIYIGNQLYKEKIDFLNPIKILIILLYVGYLSVNAFITGEMLKVVLTYVVLMMFYKMLYNIDWKKAVTGSFSVYCIILTSEILTAILLLVLNKIVGPSFQENQILVFLTINISTVIIDFIMYKIFANKIADTVKSSEPLTTQESLIIYTILLVTIAAILGKLSIMNWIINFAFIVNTIILIVFFTILLHALRQSQKYEKIKGKYSQLTEYSKINDDVLEEYRMKSHEFKNQLLVIKSMSSDENKELQEYLNTLVKNNKKNKYSWINEVKYIQLAGLKGLLNYKIMEMKSLKIDTYLNVSREVKKFAFANFSEETKDHLYSIVGVYLDNAIDASLNSEEKKVIIDVYMENDKLMITIGNTFSGKINLDRMNEYGYTTKGKSRGVGLHLVKSIIKSDKHFISTSEIRDKFFVQILTVNPK